MAKIWKESASEADAKQQLGSPPTAPLTTSWRLISTLDGGRVSLHVAADTLQDVHAVHYANATGSPCLLVLTRPQTADLSFTLPPATETTAEIARNRRPNLETWGIRLGTA